MQVILGPVLFEVGRGSLIWVLSQLLSSPLPTADIIFSSPMSVVGFFVLVLAFGHFEIILREEASKYFCFSDPN